jgi:type I restriction enzyme, S subunit
MSSKNKTIATKEEAKPALVPKLRFPEFRDAEGWKEEAGDALFDQINDRNPTPGLPVLAITQEHGAIPRHMIDYHVSVTEKSIESYKVVRVRDFIISLRSFQGGIEYSQYHGICSPAYVILRRRGKGSDEYFRHYLKTDRFIRILTKNLEGLRDGKMVSYAQFSELLLPTPTPAEQQKIAECLSSVDELMAAQARKVDALKTHKKGLMQQLFPREGETQPRLRFPEFQNAGEWEVQRLDELARYENGKAHENDISENGRYIVVNSKFISTEGDVRKFSNEGFCIADEGDILMVLSDVPNGRAIAKCYFVESDDLYTVNQRICRIQPTKVNGRFLFYVLDRNSYFLDFDDGVKQTNLRKEDVVGFPLCVPPQPDEQERIATCLSSLDALITAETQKHEALKTHKKSLMQQLFPSPEEVAG